MKKKGFTLVELLAVIVILAIIAVIATPIILGVIEKAKIGAVKQSAYGYVDAVEKQIVINSMDEDENNDFETKEKEYTVKELKTLGVKVKGTNPENGKVTINKGIVAKIEDLEISGYKLKYEKQKVTIVSKLKDSPTITITETNTTATSISIAFETNEQLSNIKSRTCYVQKDDTKYDGVINNNKCTVDGLSVNTTYTYTITLKNKDDLTATKSGSVSTSNYTADDYVKDGLVLMYDISSKPVASGSDFVWNDLSGNNNNVTLKKFSSNIDSWYSSDGITFDGTDDYGMIGEHNYSYVTVETVLEPISSKSGENDIVANYENGGYGLFIHQDKFVFQIYTSSYKLAYSTNTITYGQKYALSGLYDGNKQLLFINGDKNKEISNSGVIKAPSSNTSLALSTNPSGSNPGFGFSNIKLKNIRLYNRALTEGEIQKNYEIDKERFNIK